MVNILPGTPGPETLDGDIDAPDSVNAGDGNDLVLGNGAGTLSGATDRLFGEDGDDTLVTSSSGFGALDGGAGDDSIVAGAPRIDTGIGGAGNDTLIGDAGTDYLTGDDFDLFGAPGTTVAGADVIDGGGGDDVISGGPGDDILAPGSATRIPGTANLSGGFDQVLGGDGNDTLALEGAPQDYEIAFDPVGGVAFLVALPPSGPGSGVNAIVEDVEFVAFGVTAEELAAGEVPLTLVDWSDLFEGTTGTGGGRKHFSLSDTVPGAYGAQQVAISIADLLANDFDPDGDVLTFVALNATATAGINTFLVFTDPADIANEGYDPADFPEGLLLAFLDNPLTAPLSFTYRTQMEANGSFETGSTATVTINPGPPPPPPAAVDDTLRGTIGGTDFLLVSVLLGNDIGPLTFTGLAGMTATGTPGVFLLSTSDPITGQLDGFLRVEIDPLDPAFSNILYSGYDADFTFTYLAEDASGNSLSATVTVTVDNEKPVAANQSVTVTPGVATRIQWADIVNGAGNSDPDGDPLILASYTFLDLALGTLQGFGPVDQFDPNDFGSIEVTLNPGVTGASIEYGILDVPNLNGAQPDILNIARATLNFVTTAPPPTTYRLDAVIATTPEGTATGLSLPFTISRTGTLDAATVTFSVAAGLTGNPAEANDLVGGFGSTTVSFAANETAKTIGIGIANDAIVELDETFRITLDGATNTGQAIVIDPAAGTIAATILNDDLEQVFVAGSLPSLVEGDGNRLAFLLERDQTAVGSITVTYVIEGGTAQSADVVGGFTTGSVTFAAGESQKIVEFDVVDDTLAEGPETVQLRLTGATGAVLSTTLPLSASTTIFDNDEEEVFVGGAQLGVSESDDPAFRTFGFFIDRALVPGVDVGDATVTYVIEAGSTGVGAQSADLVGGFRAGSVTFAAGESQKLVTFEVVDDTLAEGPETVQLRLTGATGAQLSSTLPLTGTTTILDNDTIIRGTPGADTISPAAQGGSSPGVTRNPGAGDDYIEALADNDLVRGGAGNDTIDGGGGADTLFGDAGDDTISGAAGADRLEGNAGNDTLDGGEGDDALLGGSGENSLIGGDGADTIRGGADFDWILGDADDDLLFGGGGDDDIRGGAGNDTLRGDAGFNQLSGDEGDDLLFVGAGGVVFGGADQDTLVGGAGGDFLAGGTGHDSIIGARGDDTILGDAGDDTVRAGQGDDSVDAGDGADFVNGADGDDTLAGGADNDTLSGAAGADSLIGGDGLDNLGGGDGNDTLEGGNDADSIAGGTGADMLAGDAGDDTLRAGEGDDTADGGMGADLLFGAAGDDSLYGGSSSGGLSTDGDTLVGGEGADTLEGGTGDDVIDLRAPAGGGDGAADVVIYRGTLFGTLNTFLFSVDDGFDQVLGFEAGLDTVLIPGREFGQGAVLTPTLTEADGSTLVTFTGVNGLQLGAGIMIEGVTGLTATLTPTIEDWIIT